MVGEEWCCSQNFHKSRSEWSLSPHIWLTQQSQGEPAGISSSCGGSSSPPGQAQDRDLSHKLASRFCPVSTLQL